MEQNAEWQRTSLIGRVIERVCTPIYEPKNKYWELTFKELGLTRATIESLWGIFWRINKSSNGHINILEFLDYFNFDRSLYTEKSFEYFDMTGSDSVNFLEFVISVTSICNFELDTLTNFAFDVYDLNHAGELSLPDLEMMVENLYGSNLSQESVGRSVFSDIISFAEVRGGVLNLNSFTIFTANHSLLLLPVFNIQRKIQTKVMGMRFWRKFKERNLLGYTYQRSFDARQAHLLVRTYKKGGVQAMIQFCGNPKHPLVEFYGSQQNLEDRTLVDRNLQERYYLQVKNEKIKIAANKIKKMNVEQREKLKGLVHGVSSYTIKSIEGMSSSILDRFIGQLRAVKSFMSFLNPLQMRAFKGSTLSSSNQRLRTKKDGKNIEHSSMDN
jgi:Ca2+-binding EF-hand superfamily protein